MQDSKYIIVALDFPDEAGTLRMLKDHPEADAAVLVMGRAHVRGVERQLIEKHGFLPAQL